MTTRPTTVLDGRRHCRHLAASRIRSIRDPRLCATIPTKAAPIRMATSRMACPAPVVAMGAFVRAVTSWISRSTSSACA
ncbi:hypothetical protein [Streptomyces sp. bgisy082]|uniref:hypothetical protein n=1 Tax=Streptomyces sp. bgisy082 TaxID=3413776 RepID=UPI003D7139F1